MTPRQHVEQLLSFIDASPSPYHVVATIETWLACWQFEKLSETETWTLHANGRYYVVRDDSSIIVFVTGSQTVAESGYKIIGAHTDSPGLRLKANASDSNHGLLRLGVDIYGSPILATFADRDLSLAGRIHYKTDTDKLNTRLLHLSEALLRLPNLAIHLNRNVNEEVLKLHKHSELPLILAAADEQLPQTYWYQLLAEAAKIKPEQILTVDLSIYDTQKGGFWGAQQQFYTNSQLDNLASCHAALSALLCEENLTPQHTLVCALFDHEEVGSESHKGAAGSFLADILERIATQTTANRTDYQRALAQSFMISADMAHAYQPNFPSAYDNQHKAFVNQGVVIKSNANQRYSSDGVSMAMFIDWCQQANVPYQFYSHRNDLPCGSTIGPVISAKLGIRSVDVGCPLWAMHSIRESAGVLDHHYMVKVLSQFFNA